MSKGDWLVLARSGYQLFKAEAYCKRMGWFYEKGYEEFRTNRFTIAIRAWLKLNRGEAVTFEELKNCMLHKPSQYSIVTADMSYYQFMMDAVLKLL